VDFEAVAAVEAGAVAPVLVEDHGEAPGKKAGQKVCGHAVAVGHRVAQVIKGNGVGDRLAINQAACSELLLAENEVVLDARAVRGGALTGEATGQEARAVRTLNEIVAIGTCMQLDAPARGLELRELRVVHVPAVRRVGKARHRIHDTGEPVCAHNLHSRKGVENIVVPGDEDGLCWQLDRLAIDPGDVLLGGDGFVAIELEHPHLLI
jgi:hypothetical protein